MRIPLASFLFVHSPDEEAFLFAAEGFGYKFFGRTHESITVRISRALAQLPIKRINIVAPQGALSGGSVIEDGAATLVTFRILHMLAYTQVNVVQFWFLYYYYLFLMHFRHLLLQERKRMSVIVEHPVIDAAGRLVFVGQGPIVLYCKGADSAILSRTLPPNSAAEGQRNAFSKQQLSQWGNDGLRTLVFGSKTLDRNDFAVWNTRYMG